MANHVGMFYGYREYVFPVRPGRVTLPLWELDGRIPTRNETYSGSAADAYPAITLFPNLAKSEAIYVQT